MFLNVMLAYALLAASRDYATEQKIYAESVVWEMGRESAPL